MTGPGSRPGRERGASLVEFAIVGPLFLLLIFALIDLAIGVFSLNASEAAAANAVRVGAIARDTPDADDRIIEAFKSTGSLGIGVKVNRLVVYRPETDRDGPSAACRAGTNETGCDVYGGSRLANPGSLCRTGGGGWCPAERVGGELIGVWFEVEYGGLSGIIPVRWRRDGYAVARIEPDVAGVDR
ncbi:MAG: TadE/TadG family type IV pilus assembly protein [Acidimicrobiales bacterium]